MSYYYGYYNSGPKKVQGGIRLQSTRGAVGTTWWGQRWVAALEKICDSARLGRGKNYARQGQVISIDVSAGRVLAKVQGSYADPYTISIELPVFNAKQSTQIQQVLQNTPLLLAQLLAGEMPNDLDPYFNQVGLSLFPEKAKDLKTDCSCPDWTDPCKHIAAVYYLLAEQFDTDPFLLFRLRGLERETLIAHIAEPEVETRPEVVVEYDKEQLPTDLAVFWQGQSRSPLVGSHWPATPAPLLKQLKSPPQWRGRDLFIPTLEPIFVRAAAQAQAFLAEQDD